MKMSPLLFTDSKNFSKNLAYKKMNGTRPSSCPPPSLAAKASQAAQFIFFSYYAVGLGSTLGCAIYGGWQGAKKISPKERPLAFSASVFVHAFAGAVVGSAWGFTWPVSLPLHFMGRDKESAFKDSSLKLPPVEGPS